VPNIRVRFQLNPGREGIAFSKLAKHADGIQNLLTSLACDIGLPPDQNQWLGKDFKNGSVFSTAENQALVDAELNAKFNSTLQWLIKFNPKSVNEPLNGVSLKTIGCFAELRTPLEIDETINIGLFSEEKKAPKYYKVSRLKLEEVARAIDAETYYAGTIIGYTYEWTKGAKEPFLKIRDVATGELVKCAYDDKDYKKVAGLFAHKDALVAISGNISFNKITEKTEVVKANEFEIISGMTQEQYDSFFGCAKGLTAGEDAAAYVRKIRGGN